MWVMSPADIQMNIYLMLVNYLHLLYNLSDTDRKALQFLAKAPQTIIL